MSKTEIPYQYALKVSPRAKHLRIAVKPYIGLEVVIPKRFPRKQIPGILQQHEAWITSQLNKHADSFKKVILPNSLSLACTDQIFQVKYKSCETNKLQQQGNSLMVKHADEDQAIQLLRQWVRKTAKEVLPPLLQNIARDYKLSYNRVSLRTQKSRWGSCSSSGTISLNDQLLFMPEETVRYLMIHELCHTRHMNHSPKFWQLVESLCPEFRTHEETLHQGRNHIPAWFLKSIYSAK